MSLTFSTAVLLGLLLVGLASFYGGFVLFCIRGFRRLRPVSAHTSAMVSVIVAARNEAGTIGGCLTSILASDTLPVEFEIIVVDDHSTDGTMAEVRRLSQLSEARVELQCLQAKQGTGKWNAIQEGAQAARGDILLFTDADCRVPPGWVRAMAATMQENVGFVSGPVLFEPRETLWQKAQALEFMGLVAVGAGSIGAGRPTICNGANIAIRRELFVEHAGEVDETAGADELLMHRIAQDSRWEVQFCADLRAAVTSVPTPDVLSFLRQRARWASQAGAYGRVSVTAALAAIYLFYVLLLAGTLAAAFAPALKLAVAAAWIIKIVPEATLLYMAARAFDRRSLLWLFLPLQPLQVPYIVGCAGAGALGLWSWK